MKWESLEDVADGIVTVLTVLLLLAIIGVFVFLGLEVLREGGIALGLVALIPVTILVLICLSQLRMWYRSL